MALLRRTPEAGILKELEHAARENWKVRDAYATGERKFRLRNIWADRKIVRRLEQVKKSVVTMRFPASTDNSDFFSEEEALALKTYTHWLTNRQIIMTEPPQGFMGRRARSQEPDLREAWARADEALAHVPKALLNKTCL